MTVSEEDWIRAHSKSEDYSGWKNKETWLVHLWLANTEELYLAARVAAKYPDAEAMMDLGMLAADLYNAKGLGHDLLSLALSRVDWDSVREAFTED